MKLVISGSAEYIRRMYAHLLKEHPSTRGRMRITNGSRRKKS